MSSIQFCHTLTGSDAHQNLQDLKVIPLVARGHSVFSLIEINLIVCTNVNRILYTCQLKSDLVAGGCSVPFVEFQSPSLTAGNTVIGTTHRKPDVYKGQQKRMDAVIIYSILCYLCGGCFN